MSTGGRPTAKRASEIGDRILTATIQAFAKVGGRLSLDDIAADAQVSKQAIYRRYSGKSELIRAVIDRALDGILVSQDTPIPTDPRAALRHWAWRLFVNNSSPSSADFSRHLLGMTMESIEVREAVANWETRLLEPIAAALATLGAGHDLAGYAPEEAGRLLYDLVITGARRVSDSWRDGPVSDAERRRQFERRWTTFADMLGL
jgi:AcrR family transcriptional regulator